MIFDIRLTQRIQFQNKLCINFIVLIPSMSRPNEVKVYSFSISQMNTTSYFKYFLWIRLRINQIRDIPYWICDSEKNWYNRNCETCSWWMNLWNIKDHLRSWSEWPKMRTPDENVWIQMVQMWKWANEPNVLPGKRLWNYKLCQNISSMCMCYLHSNVDWTISLEISTLDAAM